MLITMFLLIQSFMFKIYKNYEFTDKMVNLSPSRRNLKKITRRHNLKKLPKPSPVESREAPPTSSFPGFSEPP